MIHWSPGIMRLSKSVAFTGISIALLSLLPIFAEQVNSNLDKLKSPNVPVTLAFTDTPASRIFDALGKAAGFTARYDAKTDEKMTIDLKGLSLHKALEMLAAAGNFVYEVPDPERLVIRTAKERR